MYYHQLELTAPHPKRGQEIVEDCQGGPEQSFKVQSNPFPLVLNPPNPPIFDPPNIVPICNKGEVLLLGVGGLVLGRRGIIWGL